MKDPKRCWEGRRGAGKDRKATVAGTEEVMVGTERCRQGPESYRGLDRRGAAREGEVPARTGKLQGPGPKRLLRKEGCREGPESYSGRDGRGAGKEEEVQGRTEKL